MAALLTEIGEVVGSFDDEQNGWPISMESQRSLPGFPSRLEIEVH
jgi:hypothetical protein